MTTSAPRQLPAVARRRCAIAVSAHRIMLGVMLLFLAPSTNASELSDLVGAALERSPEVQTARAALPARAAVLQGAERWLKSEPRLDGQVLSDRWDSDVGAAEQEFAISAELWLPRERAAAVEQARREEELGTASLALLELEVAGAVREAYWVLVLAERELVLDRELTSQAAATRDAVRRLVDAREAPPNDLRLAEATLAEAQATLQRTSARAHDAASTLERLTGSARITAAAEARAVPPDGYVHPLHRAAVERASALSAATDRTRRTPGASPELGVVMRRERFFHGGSYDESLGLRVTIPLRLSPDAAASRIEAGAQALGAALEVERAAERVRVMRQSALRALEVAQDGLELGAKRRDALAEYVEAITQAYRAGEVSFLELQRARTEGAAARRAYVEAETAVGRALSLVNQAEGLLP